jgi:chromosome segregation ATPase
MVMREPKKVRTKTELIKSCRGLREHNEALKQRIKELEAENEVLHTRSSDRGEQVLDLNLDIATLNQRIEELEEEMKDTADMMIAKKLQEQEDRIEELEAALKELRNAYDFQGGAYKAAKAKLDAAESFSRSVWVGEGGGNDAFEKAWWEALQQEGEK